MWELQGTPIDPQQFAPFEPLQVLNYYDGPRIFTFEDAESALCLACWSDEAEDRSRFLVVRASQSAVAELEAGTLCIREALDRSRTWWVVDLGYDGTLLEAWSVSPSDVPADAQPSPGVLLHRSSVPVSSLRLPSAAVRSNADFVVKKAVQGT